jgi:hypothetical protein
MGASSPEINKCKTTFTNSKCESSSIENKTRFTLLPEGAEQIIFFVLHETSLLTAALVCKGKIG